VENQTIKKLLFLKARDNKIIYLDRDNIKMLDEFVARKLNIQKVFIFLFLKNFLL
jgi:hypothetical protein